jgi:hypothetical protein
MFLRTVFTTTDPLHVDVDVDVEMLYVLYRYFDPWSPIHVIKLNTNIKIVKSLKFSVKTGPIYKM